MRSPDNLRRTCWLALCFASLVHAEAPCDGTQCELRVLVTKTPGFSEAPLSAARELVVGDRVQVLDQDSFGLVSNLGGPVTIGAHSKVGGAFAGGVLRLGDSSSIAHDVYARSVLPDTRVTERALRKPPGADALSMIWSVHFPAPAQLPVNLAPASTLVVAPAYYRELRLHEKSTVTLRTGTYYFDNLHVARGAHLRLDDREGTVVIHVRDFLVFEGALEFVGARSDVMLDYFGTRRLDIVGKFDGTILAPYATLAMHAVQGAHEGMFHADVLRIDDGTSIRKAKISGRGAAMARLRTQTTQEAARFANAVSASDLENDGMPFPDTAAGRLLNDAFVAMSEFGPDADAGYAAAARQLHANAELVMPLLVAQYDRLPESLETQVRRLTLVEMMRMTSHAVAYEPLMAIAHSPVNPSLSAMQRDDHSRPTMYEDIIRARAVNGLGELARGGHVDATSALLDFALHGAGMQQQYAAREYLASGDQAAHRATLRAHLPPHLQYLAD